MSGDRTLFAIRALTLLAAAAIWAAGKASGYREAEHLFVKGAEFGRRHGH